MKKFLLNLLIFSTIGVVNSQSLPPVAQALYNEAVAQDPQIVQYAINAGAQIIATPDDSSFYIQWFPAGPPPASSPLIVTLHGSSGFAFHEFFNWHQSAMQHGCGIIALQWYRGDSSLAPFDYFNDSVIYNDMDTALSRINYPSGNALLHGFSRGSARSYAIIFEDIQSGNNYFCTTISNAGGADPLYPLYYDINNNVYGSNVFAGKRWALYCGSLDSAFNQSGCQGMTNTQAWLQNQGAIVDVFFQDPVGPHSGFHDTTIYRDSTLIYYLQCFNGLLSINNLNTESGPEFFPNPFSNSIRIGNPENLASIVIYNSFGQIVMYSESISSEINTSTFSEGIYILQITDWKGIVSQQKLIKTSSL